MGSHLHDDYWLGKTAVGLGPLGGRAAGHLVDVAGSCTHAGDSFAGDFLAGQNLALAGQNLVLAVQNLVLAVQNLVLSSVDREAVCLAHGGYVHQCVDAGNQGSDSLEPVGTGWNEGAGIHVPKVF